MTGSSAGSVLTREKCKFDRKKSLAASIFLSRFHKNRCENYAFLRNRPKLRKSVATLRFLLVMLTTFAYLYENFKSVDEILILIQSFWVDFADFEKSLSSSVDFYEK